MRLLFGLVLWPLHVAFAGLRVVLGTLRLARLVTRGPFRRRRSLI